MSSQNSIVVKFKNQPKLYITLDDNATAHAWVELFKKNYEREFPIFRDQKKYTLDYLNWLALQAKHDLGWDCETNIKSIDDTVLLHKCLETTLNLGFSAIPAIYDNLIHELHFCLHKIESIDFEDTSISRKWLQIEWFNNDGFDLDINFTHKLDLQFGDVRLQNPFVGHIPLQMFYQNDTHNISQTCKFHDFVRPGMYIHTMPSIDIFDKQRYLDWWQTNAPEFVEQHSMEKILHYTGHPVIGTVLNLNDLETIANDNNILELEYVFTG